MVRMRLMQRVSDMLDSGLGSRHMHIYHGCCTSCPPARVTEQVTKIAGPELWYAKDGAPLFRAAAAESRFFWIIE